MLKKTKKHHQIFNRKCSFFNATRFAILFGGVLSAFLFRMYIFIQNHNNWLISTESDFLETNYNPEEGVFNTRKFFNDQYSSWLFSDQLPCVEADIRKRDQIKYFFMRAYNSYKDRCWGQDYYHPITDVCSNSIGFGLSAIESATTLYLMGEHEEFYKIKQFLMDDHFLSGDITTYEFVTGVIGSLISSYELSGEKMFLYTARDLTNIYILPLFDKENDFLIPHSITFNRTEDMINMYSYDMRERRRKIFANNNTYIPESNYSTIIHSEGKDVPSFFLELLKLAELTGNMSYVEYALGNMKRLMDSYFFDTNKENFAGLISQRISNLVDYSEISENVSNQETLVEHKPTYEERRIARIYEENLKKEKMISPVYSSLETIYENIPKLYFLTRGRIPQFINYHMQTRDNIMKNKLDKNDLDRQIFENITADYRHNANNDGNNKNNTTPKQNILNNTNNEKPKPIYIKSKEQFKNILRNSYLTALVNGALEGNEVKTQDITRARAIILDQCHTIPNASVYEMDASGYEYDESIMENLYRYGSDESQTSHSIYNITQPFRLPVEILEPMYILWKRSGEDVFRKCAWDMFYNIKHQYKCKNGVLSILGTKDEPSYMIDITEPVFFSEVMKYLYLIFSSSNYFSTIEWIYNSDGQPFRMINSTMMDIMKPIIAKYL